MSLSSNVIYYLIFLFALSYPAAAVLERTVSHVLTRAFYTFSSAWMGISIFIVIILIGYEILNLIFYVPPFIAGISIIALASILSAYSILNSIPLEIKNVEINIPTLKRNMNVVQLSDIHIGSVRNSGFMKKIAQKTNELNPDIVLITG
ncbi:MAG: metallophosphoesterase, partial [Methanobacterium sp.]